MSSLQKKVSVIVPIYNVERFLNRCIESIVNQSYESIEIILVDDGSPDNCPAMCDKWALKDPRIKVIHKPNGGLGFARNSGLEVATGDYVMFIDSDDYIDLQTVEKCLKSAEENNASVVMFGRSNVYPDGRVEPKKIITDKLNFCGRDEILDLLSGLFTYKNGMGVSAWGKLYDLNLFKENRLLFKSEREIISEDAYFMLGLFNYVSTAAILPESLYFYYKNSNSLSQVYKEDRQEKNDVFINECIKLCKALGYKGSVINHVTARYHAFYIAALKQLCTAEISYFQKKRTLKKAYQSSVLRASLKNDVLSLESPSQRLFWRLFDKGFLTICYILLRYKSR